MICPKCGFKDKSIPTPEITRSSRMLGTCKSCNHEIWAMGTTKTGERSQAETVAQGEEREVLLANIYVKHFGYAKHEKSDENDIDRIAFDSNGEPLCYFEIKERSNSLNAYKDTKFPFAKIDAGIDIIKNRKIPVFIVLKFTDGWAQHKVSTTKAYRKGNAPFAPKYRPYQNSLPRQVPVMLDVEEDFEIIKM